MRRLQWESVWVSGSDLLQSQFKTHQPVHSSTTTGLLHFTLKLKLKLKMDFWTENQGHLPQYNKFNSLPPRSYAQNYNDRQPPHQYQVYCEETRAKNIDSGYNWPPRENTNWPNQEPVAPTSPLQFPFNLDQRIHHYQTEPRQETQDWTHYQHQERSYPHESWSYNPAHYKHELSKKNDNNFRELEAWALRYSHSLPRRRRIEAELRGAMQDKREIQMPNVQETTLRDRASRQQLAATIKPHSKLSDQAVHSPAEYNSPPPYSVQRRNVSMLAKQSYELPQVKTEKALAMNLMLKSWQKIGIFRQKGKLRLSRTAGGLTIFCLVSRIADTEPEKETISQAQSQAAQHKASDVKVRTQNCKRFRSAKSRCQNGDKNTQKSNEVSAFGKLAAKFPLWRRPSFTSAENEHAACSKDSESVSKIDTQSQKLDAKDGDATLTIDTTCVVVKMELLQAPKKEQVHYLSSENQATTGQTLANEAEQNISTKQEGMENFVLLAEQANGEKDVLPTETLEERAERICGLRETKMTQKEVSSDFGIEDLDNYKTEIALDKRVFVGKNEQTQSLQANSCTDHEIGESKETIMEDNGKEYDEMKHKMVECLEEEETNEHCKESVEISDQVIICNTSELNKQGIDEDISSSPKSSDLVEKIEDCDVDELDSCDKIANEKELEMCEEQLYKSLAMNTSQQLDSGQTEDAITSENTENDQNQCVNQTDTANVELYGCNKEEVESVSTILSQVDENIEVSPSDLEITEKETDADEEQSMEQVQVNDLEQEIENDLKEQLERRDEACANENELITDTKETILSDNVQGNQGIEPTALTEEDILRDVEQNTGKDEENVTEVDLMPVFDRQEDVDLSTDVKDKILSDLEVQENLKLNDTSQSGQEDCKDKTTTSVQTAQAADFEANNEKELIKDIDELNLPDEKEKEEINIDANCAKLHSETVDLFVEDCEQAKETEIRNNVDLKEEILDEISKIDASVSDINDLDLEENEWEDATDDSNITTTTLKFNL
ncbi:hypothetical protein WMY93_011407 [Mugilogobius chulae]|uniref:Uncharacterized protein n=1 Tax=Mugilogobius chulae TaxID=88201 RepID=A0AAW0PDQ7_9GOBI